MNRAGISNLTGLAGAANIQGEDQKKLDVISNEVFCNALRASGRTVRLIHVALPEPRRGRSSLPPPVMRRALCALNLYRKIQLAD